MKMLTKIHQQNVNGIPLTLTVEPKSECPKSRIFTIFFKKKENKSSFSKFSLFLAVIFNILSIFYIRISLNAILITVIVLSFLLVLWITHSVQSESIVVIPSVGIQCSVKYVYGREDNFVPWNTIDDVIINEVIKLNRVLYFLTILVKSDTEPGGIKLIPLFKVTLTHLSHYS
ncbi:unnamed protein product [Plutella xylostella]|uniref:(diamondback moth) hypothetical protein n=1 Tax=Plutella xylostella TaxID=51655 RepID=A0A8S4G3J7_PLUXY|nr:unnamed protein product [Plutella xylostella]